MRCLTASSVTGQWVQVCGDMTGGLVREHFGDAVANLVNVVDIIPFVATITGVFYSVASLDAKIAEVTSSKSKART